MGHQPSTAASAKTGRQLTRSEELKEPPAVRNRLAGHPQESDGFFRPCFPTLSYADCDSSSCDVTTNEKLRKVFIRDRLSVYFHDYVALVQLPAVVGRSWGEVTGGHGKSGEAQRSNLSDALTTWQSAARGTAPPPNIHKSNDATPLVTRHVRQIQHPNLRNIAIRQERLPRVGALILPLNPSSFPSALHGNALSQISLLCEGRDRRLTSNNHVVDDAACKHDAHLHDAITNTHVDKTVITFGLSPRIPTMKRARIHIFFVHIFFGYFQCTSFTVVFVLKPVADCALSTCRKSCRRVSRGCVRRKYRLDFQLTCNPPVALTGRGFQRGISGKKVRNSYL